MSTRAVYSFVDGFDTFHVYKHHDGYPSGAAKVIRNAIPLAWPFPRFEPDQFACAFIAGNPGDPGAMRLTHGPDHHGDLAYRYEVGYRSCDLWVKAFRIRASEDEELCYAPLETFEAWAASAGRTYACVR